MTATPTTVDEDGKKQYAYHPEPLRNRCIGIDSPHLCLSAAGVDMSLWWMPSQAPIVA